MVADAPAANRQTIPTQNQKCDQNPALSDRPGEVIILVAPQRTGHFPNVRQSYSRNAPSSDLLKAKRADVAVSSCPLCPWTPFFNDGGYTVSAHCNGSKTPCTPSQQPLRQSAAIKRNSSRDQSWEDSGFAGRERRNADRPSGPASRLPSIANQRHATKPRVSVAPASDAISQIELA